MLGIKYKLTTFHSCFRKFYLKAYYFLNQSHSQYGEDLILRRLLKDSKNRTYIDIGCNHPTHFNNTYWFYKNNWKGINIEPNPHLFRLIQASRPEDINLNCGISSTEGSLDFYSIEPDTLSTFSKDIAKRAENEGASIKEVVKVNTIKLQNLWKYLPELNASEITLLSIDVEGLEMEVLSSNDWNQNRPKIIIIEVNRDESNIDLFLKSKSYTCIFNNGTNAIYEDQF